MTECLFQGNLYFCQVVRSTDKRNVSKIQWKYVVSHQSLPNGPLQTAKTWQEVMKEVM